MARRMHMTFACVVVALALSVTARAGVRMSEDEVVFTLRAPEATSVHLVGDFNNWNATVEPMPRDGDVFEITLFLVEGTYRYKFVVDGRWIADPDNPGSDPKAGSPLVLVEQGGILMLSTEVSKEAAAQTLPDFGIRYIGQFLWRDSDYEDAQRVDAGVRVTRDRLLVRGVISSDDASWQTSKPYVEAFVNRGFVEVEAAGMRLRGFENDTTWVSAEPTRLVGDGGLYGYNAGFERHGVSATIERSAFALRVVYDDHVGRGNAAIPVVRGDDLSGFRAGAGADTTAYAYENSWDDGDQFGGDVSLKVGDARIGYARRHDRGLNPGVLTDIARVDSTYDATVYATREFRSLSVWWLRYAKLFGMTLDLAFGSGSSDIVTTSAGEITGDLTQDIDPSVAATSHNRSLEMMTSRRTLAAISRNAQTWDARLGWQGYGFTFPATRYARETRADVHRVRASGSFARGEWSFGGAAVYTHQDYGDTPDGLVIDSPERNIWLNLWDNLSVANIVGIGVDAYTNVELEGGWTTGPEDAVNRTRATATVDVTMEDVVGRPLRAAVGLAAEQVLRRYIVIVADGVWVNYDHAAWGVNDSFVYGYIEAGYRRGPVYVNVGYGFDPNVFDPVINDYADIGRSEQIRQAIADGVRRSAAADIGAAAVGNERDLGRVSTIKLECIIRF